MSYSKVACYAVEFFSVSVLDFLVQNLFSDAFLHSDLPACYTVQLLFDPSLNPNPKLLIYGYKQPNSIRRLEVLSRGQP